MSDAPFRYTDPDTGTEYEWHGGEYVEIGYTATRDTGPFNNLGQPSYYAGDFVAHDVFNVWDTAAGVPRIDRTQEAFEEYIRAQLAGDEDDE